MKICLNGEGTNTSVCWKAALYKEAKKKTLICETIEIKTNFKFQNKTKRKRRSPHEYIKIYSYKNNLFAVLF
jgi:hypothetical protein